MIRLFDWQSAQPMTLALLGMVAALLWSSTAAAQQAPCSGMSEAESARYYELSIGAVEDYRAGAYDASIRKSREALRLCDADSKVAYNLARAYHKSGDCHMADYHYDRLLDGKIDKKTKKKVKKYAKSLKCKGADFRITCTSPGTVIDFGPWSAEPCPLEGRIEPGRYLLVGSSPGASKYQEDVAVASGGTNEFRVPALEVHAELGTLSVTCSEGVSNFTISGPDGQDQRPCPWEGEVAVGRYTLDAEGAPDSVTVMVEGRQRVVANVEVPQAPFDRPGVLVGVQVAPGVGLVDSRLYEDGKKTPDSVTGPSTISFAAILEVGYALSAHWAVLAHARVDLGLGIVGGVLGRFVPWQANPLAVRLDFGLGGGTMVQPVNLPVERNSPQAHAGPFFVLAGGDFAYGLSDLAALVVGVDLNVAVFERFALHADLTLGVELRF